MYDEFFEYVGQGGWVMLPLLLVSVLLWTLVVERWQVLRALQRSDLNLNDILSIVRGQREAPSESGLRLRLVTSFARERTGRVGLDRKILAQITTSLSRSLEQRLEIIAVLATVAPLLGLLGTVLGMIETFRVISDFGTGNARAMAGGISVALVTTQSGLLVAIPGLIASHRLQNEAEVLRTRLAETHHAIDRDLTSGEGTKP